MPPLVDTQTPIKNITTVFPDNSIAFSEPPEKSSQHTEEFVYFYDATFDVNEKRIDTKNHTGVADKEEASFFAVDTFQNILAAQNNISLPDYGADQTIRNQLSVQLFHDVFQFINPELELETRKLIAENPRYSYSSILSYVMVNNNQSLSITDIPDYYRLGIIPNRICHEHNLQIPTAEQISQSVLRNQSQS